MIFFIPKSFSFSLPIELYLPVLDLSESPLFRNVFFLLEVYKAVLKSIPLEFFLFKDPGAGFLDVSYIGFENVSGLKNISLVFVRVVFSFRYL